MKNTHLCLLSVLLLIPSAWISPASAGETTALTEDMIRQFYSDSVATMKKPYKEYLAFLDKSFSEAYKSKQTITLNLPGKPPSTQTSEEDKNKVMNISEEAFAVTQKADVANRIQNIDFTPDHQTAHVTDTTTIKATLPDKDGSKLSMETASVCHDTVGINGANPQYMESDCTTTTTIRK